MDKVNLRICTMKSRLGIGKFPNEPVERIIGAHHTRELRHIYYTVSYIDFTQDVKDAIHITHPISKPGVDLEAEALNNAEMNANLKGMAGLKYRSTLSKWQRDTNKAIAHEHSLTKGQLQAVNHGHAYLNEQNE